MKLSGAVGCPALPEYTHENKSAVTNGNLKLIANVTVKKPQFNVVHSGLPLTSSRFHVRLLRDLGSRLSGARGRSSTGLPLISGALLAEITGGIFL